MGQQAGVVTLGKKRQDRRQPAQVRLLLHQPHEELMRVAGKEEGEEAQAVSSRPPPSVASFRCGFLRGWGGSGSVCASVHTCPCVFLCGQLLSEGSS